MMHAKLWSVHETFYAAIYGSVDRDSHERWRHLLQDCQNTQAQTIVFLCEKMRYIDGAEVIIWIQTIQALHKRGHRCRIIAPQAPVHETLESLGFYELTGLRREPRNAVPAHERQLEPQTDLVTDYDVDAPR